MNTKQPYKGWLVCIACGMGYCAEAWALNVGSQCHDRSQDVVPSTTSRSGREMGKPTVDCPGRLVRAGTYRALMQDLGYTRNIGRTSPAALEMVFLLDGKPAGFRIDIIRDAIRRNVFAATPPRTEASR